MSSYVLGLSGWFDRGHDASAAIVSNGKILAMAEEERFTRKKHAYDSLPLRSTAWCLDHLGLTLDDIDSVAVGWNLPKMYEQAGINEPALNDIHKVFFPSKYFKYTKVPHIEFVDHHLAHAASAFYISGMEESAILVLDGQGEDVSATFAVGRGNQIKTLDSLPVKYSMGYFYEAVSDFIGLGSNAPGKTMGLAPYGNSRFDFPNIKLNKKAYSVNLEANVQGPTLDKQQILIEAWSEVFKRQFGNPATRKRSFSTLKGNFYNNPNLNKLHKDIAASAQYHLEKVVVHCVNKLVTRTGLNKLCFSGGTALNCSANTLILAETAIDELFVPPFTNDGGVSAGAALLTSGVKAKTKFHNTYLGPEYRNEDIEKLLIDTGLKYQRSQNIVKDVAQRLAEGKILGWFQGRMEAGPRALGNRSILAHPGMREMHNKVNKAKHREQWRPLAPSVIYDQQKNYFKESYYSPFMLHNFSVKPKRARDISAVAHVDDTSRAQSVTHKLNPLYHSLISEFSKLTGLPLLLNTSFNGLGEPIVCSPLDAIETFATSSMHGLAMGDFIVEK